MQCNLFLPKNVHRLTILVFCLPFSLTGCLLEGPASIDGSSGRETQEDIGGDESLEIPEVNVIPDGAFRGVNSRGEISGYAYDRNSPGMALTIQVFIDQDEVTAQNLEDYMPDLEFETDTNYVSIGVFGKHQFIDFPLPNAFNDGQSHSLRIFALDSEGGVPLQLGSDDLVFQIFNTSSVGQDFFVSSVLPVLQSQAAGCVGCHSSTQYPAIFNGNLAFHEYLLKRTPLEGATANDNDFIEILDQRHASRGVACNTQPGNICQLIREWWEAEEELP